MPLVDSYLGSKASLDVVDFNDPLVLPQLSVNSLAGSH